MYGTVQKDTGISYTSSYKTSTQVFSASITEKSLSRSGVNGIYTKDKRTYAVITVKRSRMKFIGFQYYYIRRRVIAGYRIIAGKPRYKRILIRNGRQAYRIIVPNGFTPDRRKPYYKVQIFQKRRKIFQRVYYEIRKKIAIPTVLYPDIAPHKLATTAVLRTGHSDGYSISFWRDSDPNVVGVTNVVGCQSGVHAVAGGVTFGRNVGFLDFSSDYETISRMRTESLYRLFNNARNGIAVLANIAVEHEGLKRTVSTWVIDTLSALLKGKRAVTRALTDLASDPKKIASAYLGYVYGVSPMISDINNLINEMNEVGRTWRRYIGKSKHKYETVETGSNGVSSWTITRTFEWKLKNQVCVTGTRIAPIIQNHANTNNLAAGWEFLPWSFVIDWFIPISNWLASFDLFQNVAVKFWHESVLYRETYKYELRPSGSLYGYTFVGEPVMFSGEMTKFSRKINGGSPSLPFPQFKSPFSKTHSVNAIMLLITSLKR